jgi:glycosyltransferase involved in cell wall biosynthesis
MDPLVSVIIPTFRRAPFLKYALEALRKQTYRHFEVVVAVKPGGDETEKLLTTYRNWLPIKILFQREGYVSNAYNIALREAKGDIIVIMDDDSVPNEDWLQQYVALYKDNDELGGVSGAAISADFDEKGKLTPVPEATHLIRRWQEYYYSRWSFNRPLNGMSDWWIFFGKDGLVHKRTMLLSKNFDAIVPSLLLMGANMSVRRKAIEGLEIDEELLLGFTYEQLLAYEIWRRGYKVVHNPRIKVLHIVHEQSLGRFFKTPERAAHRDAEYILSFFILKSKDHEVSWYPYLLQLSTLIVSRALKIRYTGFIISLARIYGLMYGFVVGCAYNISKFVGGLFSIKTALAKFIET